MDYISTTLFDYMHNLFSFNSFKSIEKESNKFIPDTIIDIDPIGIVVDIETGHLIRLTHLETDSD